MKHEIYPDQDIRITTRLPADVHQWLVKSGRNSDRSMNRQLINTLRNAMAQTQEHSQCPANAQNSQG